MVATKATPARPERMRLEPAAAAWQGRGMDPIELASDALRCTISPLGAELQSLTGRDGREYLWDGDPAWWSGRAPILFPIVGMLAGGEYRWHGRRYAMAKHGFARTSHFALVEQEAGAATLRLVADAATRKIYPFEFELDLRFALDTALTVTATVRNQGAGAMPFSFGFHPALRWSQREGARLLFGAAEAGPVWRMNRDGLLDRSEGLPGDGRTLALSDALFADDAMILRGVASREVSFESGGEAVRVAWDNLPDLGLWTKPGAPYLCIEPWAGYNDPAGFAGELGDKPGIVMLAAGEAWRAAMTISPEPA